MTCLIYSCVWWLHVSPFNEPFADFWFKDQDDCKATAALLNKNANSVQFYCKRIPKK